MSRRRPGGLVLLLAAAALGLLALTAAPASAHVIHNFESSFPVQATGGPQGNPGSDAFDQTSGNLWVLDASNQTVDEFAPDGTYQNLQLTGSSIPAGSIGSGSFGFQFFNGVAVDNSGGANAGDLYVTDWGNGVIDKFDSQGNYLCQITGQPIATTTSPSECAVTGGVASQGTPQGGIGPSGLAVDSSGNLWVADLANDVIDEFGPSGEFLTQISDPNLINPTQIGLDSAGNLYVTNHCNDLVKFSGGAFAGVLDSNCPVGLATDPGSDRVYISDLSPQPQFTEYDTSGNQISSFPAQSGFVPGGAIRPATGELYANDWNNGQIDRYTGDLVVPDVVTGQASSLTLTAATLNGTVNPDATTITDCHFDYVNDAQYDPQAQNPYQAGQTAPCVPDASLVPADSNDHQVSADVSALTPGTVYHFRLVAANADGTSFGSDQAFATGPVIASEWSTGVTSVAATLHTKINPEGSDTTYHFEYGTTTAYVTSIPAPDGDIGAGTGDVSVNQTLSGLQPATTYHYRVVATNSLGAVDGPDHTFTTFGPPPAPQSCPNAQFRTGPSAALPDCRAWEQVSPVDKSDQDAYRPTLGASVEGAADGNKLMYQSTTSYGNAQANGTPDVYLATRGAAGWQTANVSPPTPDPVLVGGFQLDYKFSPDLSQAVYEVPAQSLAPGAAPNVENLFLRHSDGSFSTITTGPRANGCPPDNPYGAFCFQINSKTTFAGASADFSHVIFEANDSLTPDAPGGGVNNLYQEVGGQDSFVGILPDGAAAAGGSQPGSGEFAKLNTCCVSDLIGAISSDGSRIFFTAAADGGQPDPAQSGLSEVFERVGGTSTVEVSAPAPGAAPANSTPESAEYWGASRDGALVFFTSPAELTTDANTGSGNAGNDLYEFDTATGTLTDLSADTHPADAATGANVQGVVGNSTDGSYVYFVADGQLVSGQGSDRQPNLYLYHAGQVSFITTLAPGDAADWTNTRSDLQSYVTPDGRHLGFMSTLPLTGYDNTDQSTGQSDSEVFEYSAPTGQLVCASCDPTGAEPVGNAYLGADTQISGLSQPLYQPRVLSDDGSRLFFSSPDALTPGASSSHVKIYEYEHGTVSLIAPAISDSLAAGSGRLSSGALFIDASARGDDLFIATRDQLVGSDQDQLIDVYDARVDGGFPAAATLPSCQGDACQGAPTPPPPLPVAGTVSFGGPGNAAPGPLPAKPGVLTRTVHGTTFLLRVQLPAGGRITISGAGIRTVRRSVSRVGTYALRVTLTPGARRALARRHRLGLRLRVGYAPPGAGAQTAEVRVTVLPALRHRASHARRATKSIREGAR